MDAVFTSIINAAFGYAARLLSDVAPVMILALGIPLGFTVIMHVVALFRR